MTNLALGNGISVNPKSKFRVFTFEGNKYILENSRTVACCQADKVGNDTFVSLCKKLEDAGCDVTKGMCSKDRRKIRLHEIRQNPLKKARYNKLKLALNPELKARYERMTKNKGLADKAKGLLDKVKEFAKTKTGKYTMAGVGALALVAILAKCMGGKKEPQEVQQ